MRLAVGLVGWHTLLTGHLGVVPHPVHAQVVGEHGDSEVLTWPLATIGGTTLDAFCHLHQVWLDAKTQAAH